MNASLSATTPTTIYPISFTSHRSFKVLRRYTTPNFKPYPTPFRILTTQIAFSSSKSRAQISEQFGGRGKFRIQRNRLREKILEKELVGIPDEVSSSNLVQQNSDTTRLEKDENVWLSKLESWVEQYTKDVEQWGIGTEAIFTVFEDLNGHVERVVVNEDEIRARSGLGEDEEKVNSRVVNARMMAKELESGKHVGFRNSTVAKFVVSSGKGVKNLEDSSPKIEEVKELDDFRDNEVSKASEIVEFEGGFGVFTAVRSAVLQLQPGLYPKLSTIGIAAFGGMLLLLVLKSVFAFGDRANDTTLKEGVLEGEGKLEEDVAKVSVEVVDVSSEAPKVSIVRPKLNKEEILRKITKNKAPQNGTLLMQKASSSEETEGQILVKKVQEIRDAAKYVREAEAEGSLLLDKHKETDVVDGNVEAVQLHVNEASDQHDIKNGNSMKTEAAFDGKSTYVDNNKTEEITSMDSDVVQSSSPSGDNVIGNVEIPASEPCILQKKIRIIKSVKEARDYLSGKQDKQPSLHDCIGVSTFDSVTSLSPQSDSQHSITEIDKVEYFGYDCSPNSTIPPVGVNSSTEGADSQLTSHTDHPSNNDNVQLENSVSSQVYINFEKGPVTAVENQEAPEDRVDTNNPDRTSFSSPISRTKRICSDTPRVKNDGTTFCQNNVVPNSGHDGDNDIAQTQFSVASGDYAIGADTMPENQNPVEDFEEFLSNKDISFLPLQSDMEKVRTKSVDRVPSVVSSGDLNGGKKEYQEAIEKNSKHENDEDCDASQQSSGMSQNHQGLRNNSEPVSSQLRKNWMEENFHELEPVIAKMRDGFSENYTAAQKRTEDVGPMSLSQLQSAVDDHELEWMKDDHLRDIVFKVRDNELSGREPFHMMSKEEKVAFFDGLEKKVEQENKKLLKVHEYLHSNIENLNYGADGISMYDSPEKVIPRWKGPPPERAPDFLNKSVGQKGEIVNGNVKSPLSEKNRTTSPSKVEKGAPKTPNIIIEGSDGTVQPGKKNGKEFWQHTKKWSRGFLEVYEAEQDPDVKETMREIGKDLDRWITEEEIQEAAELIEKMPERNKEFIQKKVEKIKREMELFGPQAVVSKYREYSEEKEEDYLWWLDLRHVLCIELYTNEDGEQRVGFYSLEMARDLDLEPKPHHVIAFEDTKDCRNMCYIIQAHLEMLGKGNAFVVARPPKDTFRESKANGFNVTVIRKGELTLNIDQTLEEVEEQIIEIGSKMYHDQIMKGRSVDMNALIKGVIGNDKPIKRKRSRGKSNKLSTNKQ